MEQISNDAGDERQHPDEDETIDADTIEQEELSGDNEADDSLELSETDEDEDEGVGDGNIGRTSRDLDDD